MAHELDVVLTLAGALSAALLLGTISHVLKLSPIVGYLLAGLAIIRRAQSSCTGLSISVANTVYLTETAKLAQAGAHVVVTAEAEVVLAMTERLLLSLGASPEQVDRERDRVRAEL